MAQQHTENFFRRYKGKFVNIKTISGGVYKGRVGEITNDYVALIDRETEDVTFVFFNSIESVSIQESPS